MKIMMKTKRYIRSISILLSIILLMQLCGCNISVNTDPKSVEDKEDKEDKHASANTIISEAEYPLYLTAMDNVSTIKLYFADEDKDIPYIDAETVKDLLEKFYHEINSDDGYKLTVSNDGDITTFTRENTYTMHFDSDEDEITFEDYDSFVTPSWSNTVIDTLEHYGTIDYLQINDDRSYSRTGEDVEIDLEDYDIDIIGEDGKCYVPLQTVSDVLLALPCYVNLIYNGEAVYANELGLDQNNDFLSNTYSAGKGNRSRALADFSYNELCMVMDHFYGLKEHQKIDEFDDFFDETGLKDRLLSEDSEESSKALAEFLLVYIDDLHSFYLNNSYLTGKDFNPFDNFGSSYITYVTTRGRFDKARSEQYPDGVPSYEEIGNTAYVTFDEFDELEKDADYYNEPPTADTKDTVGLLLYAFSQITRQDSPVENVVFDLSLNGGGDQTTTCFMLSMILGGSSMTVIDTQTGGYVHECFKADANLDGVFDEKDSLADYNLFCITSPLTFSCGNMAASELKYSNKVTMLGQTSGGGTCIVIPLTLADGTFFRVSSCRRMSHIKNGALYDIDLGVEPDIYIGKPSVFYDREALTKDLNSDLHY